MQRRFVTSLLVLAAIVSGCAIGASPSPTTSERTDTGTPASAVPSAASAGRSPSGIPDSLDGQPVLMGLAAAVHADATTDSTPFLVGGWFNDASVFTCSGGGSIGRDPSPLLSGCATGIGPASPPGDLASVGLTGHVFWDGHKLPTGRGPTIVRVHTHDARATRCRADSKAACEAVLVVQEVLWTGDAWTQTSPVSVADAAQTLGSLNIITSFPTGPQSRQSVQRNLFTTPVDAPCPDPWPHEVFELRGDPQFGLIAVFPDEQARTDAQTALDLANPGCAIDPRVERPAAAAWAGERNVLVLLYGDEARARMQAALDGSINRDRYTSFPPESLDESYRVVDDAEAARAAGNFNGPPPLMSGTSGDWGVYAQAVSRRFDADALSYTIGKGRPVTEVDVAPTIWRELEQSAVPGTATLYVVDHPAATDPALKTETIVAFRLREPSLDTWWLVVVPSATST